MNTVIKVEYFDKHRGYRTNDNVVGLELFTLNDYLFNLVSAIVIDYGRQ